MAAVKDQGANQSKTNRLTEVRMLLYYYIEKLRNCLIAGEEKNSLLHLQQEKPRLAAT